ncbi:MAG: histidinol-phosphate transaminase [Acidobacteriota bacterium]|nr:histidinol-phosphate transaminase [Acidobacteriota bacterium]
MSILDSVRPGVRAMAGYVPGEQPRGLKRLIKLNTNENPYPPPQLVLDAIAGAADERLRLYPEPTSLPVREAAAQACGLQPEQVLVGNGSDDLLTIILRTFVDSGETVAAPDPTYSLYKPLTDIQGGRFVTVPWNEDFSLPVDALAATGAKVIFVVRPNAPTGHAVPLSSVAELCRKAPGAVVLDEAYGDFCEDNGIPLLAEHANLIVTRSFSKSFSLAGLRIGLGFTSAELAAQMHKVRDSYNVDALAQAAATAALENLDAYAPLIQAVKEQRTRLTEALNRRGFTAPPSQANFVLAKIPEGRRDGKAWLNDLRAEGLIVRYFGSHPKLTDKLRISIGTPEEMDVLLAVIDRILESN